MGFYFSIFGVLSFFSLIEIFGLKENQRKIMFFVFSLVMFVLSFIRWETGTDWEVYYSFFESSSEWFQEREFEWGFARFNELAKIVFDSYTVLLFLLGSVLFFFQTSAIYKLSPYPVTSLLFLWSVLFGNVMFVRQSIATAILFYSVVQIIQKRFWKFMLCVGVAMLFHRTSLIFLPAWWIYRMNIKPSWLWIGVAVSVLMTATIKTAIDGMSGLFGPIVQNKLDVYLSDGDATFGAKTSLAQIIIKGIANKLLVFSALVLMTNRLCVKYQYFKGLVNLYWFGVLLYFGTIGISIAMIRFSFAYDILQVILVPILLGYVKNLRVKMVFYVLLLLYLAFRLIIAVGGYYELYVPFKTIFTI